MRNIVQVVHEECYNSGRYAFEVPLKVQLKPGDVVLVKTKTGDKIARCVTKNVMMTDDMIDMMMNGKKVTGQVIGKFEYQDFSADAEKIEEKKAEPKNWPRLRSSSAASPISSKKFAKQNLTTGVKSNGSKEFIGKRAAEAAVQRSY